MDPKIQEYLDDAARLRELARQAPTPRLREQFLEIAQTYQTLADQIGQLPIGNKS